MKPCYLFALVAGDLACAEDSFKTMSGRDVTLRIYTQAKNIGPRGLGHGEPQARDEVGRGHLRCEANLCCLPTSGPMHD